MHKEPLLLKLLMGLIGGECSAQSVSLATLPSYFFIFLKHTHTSPSPSYVSALLAFFDAANQALRHFRGDTDDYLILITDEGETLFDVLCVFLPLASYLPHTPLLPTCAPPTTHTHTRLLKPSLPLSPGAGDSSV